MICFLACGALPGAFAEDAIRPRLPKQTLLDPDASFGFDSLLRLIAERKPADPESLLKQLAPDLRGSYSLMYHSRSTQKATKERPRILVFDPIRASWVLGFAAPESRRSDVVEAMSFDPVQRTFEFSRLEFANGKVQVTHPPECTVCHRGKPIWDSYDLWPGAFGSQNDAIFLGRDRSSPEALAYADFERERPRLPLYRSLLPLNATRPNTTLGILLAQQNYLRAAKAIRGRSDFPELRPALLGALLRCDIETFRFARKRSPARSYAEQALASRFGALKSHYERENAIRGLWHLPPVVVPDETIRESLLHQLPALLEPCDSACRRGARANLEYVGSIWPGVASELSTMFRRDFIDFDDGLGDPTEAAPAFVAEMMTQAERQELFPNGIEPARLRAEGTPKPLCDRLDQL